MNKANYITKHSKKLLFAGIILMLSFLAFQPKEVHAASLIPNEITNKKIMRQNSENQQLQGNTKNLSPASKTAPELSETKAPLSKKEESLSTPTDESVTVDANEDALKARSALSSFDSTNEKVNRNPSEIKSNVVNSTWNGLRVQFDPDTGVLTIPGGTVTDPVSIHNSLDNSSNIPNVNLADIKTIEFADKLKIIGSAKNLFSYGRFESNLTSFKGLNLLDTSEVDDMSGMFTNCDKLTSLDLSGFDTSQVTSMSWMFYECNSLTKLDLSGFDTSQVTNMSWMFYKCNSLTELDLSGFDTSQVYYMFSMFGGCTNLNNLNLSSFDTSQVSNMSQMFSSCISIASLNLSNFNMSQVTDTSWMFSACSNLTDLRFGDFKTSQLKNMESMFANCKKLVEVDLRNFDTSNVTNMSSLFRGCENLSDLDLSSFNTAQVTTMTGMFQNCKRFKSLDISNFDMGLVKNVKNMLFGLDNLLILKLGSKTQLKGTNLTTPGIWQNVTAEGTVTNPKGKNKWSSAELVSNYDNKEADTYVKLGEPVIVHFQSETGKKLLDDEELSGAIYQPYLAEPKVIRGYTLKTMPTNASGAFIDIPIEVTFIYSANDGAPVTIHYQDEDGKPVASDIVITGKFDDSYQSVLLPVAGYKIKTIPQNATGKFTDEKQEVFYIYTRLPQQAAPVTIRYQDEQGNAISSDIVLTGKANEKYSSTALAIKGYTLRSIPKNASGVFGDEPQEVTYVYAQDPVSGAKVIVHYLDEDNKPIASDIVLSGNLGDSYTSSALQVNGYQIKTIPQNAQGTFTNKEQNVTYVYTKAKVNNVIVHYQDETGNAIASDIVITGKPGDNYRSSALPISGYTLKTTPENANGLFTTESQTVTYVYSKNPVTGAAVVVHYRDEANNAIASDIVLRGNLGSNYRTTPLTLTGYTLKITPTNAVGAFTKQQQEVTYIYTKNPVKVNNVIVHYQDDQGNPIASDVILAGNLGDNYVTTPQEITGYTLKTTPTNAQGKFTQNEQNVVYIYIKNPVTVNNVIIHYQDDKGNQIASDIILSGKIGDSYVTTPQEITGYTLKTIPANAKGKFTQNGQNITYIYTRDPVIINDVKVHYQDENGNSIASDIVLKGNKGENYHSTALVIKGYTLKTTPKNASGIFTDAEQSVTYVYTKNLVTGGNVNVHYLDEDSNSISSDIILSGNLGEQYSSTALTIEGYTLKAAPKNASGTFTKDEQNVTYVYTKNPAKVDNVTIHYQDEQGNPIAGDIVLSGNVGDDYVTKPQEITGYTLKTTPANAQGKFTLNAQSVTYIYTKNPATVNNVIIHYQDDKGNPIASDIVLSGKIGDDYVTKPQKIAGYTLKTTPTNAQGKFAQNAQSVIYIYTKDSTIVNDVTIHYQDDQGNQIASDIVLKGKAGDNYVTKPQEITGYTLKTTPANAEGKFTQKPQSVTYIYTKNPTRVNNVTVHYQDEAGNQIASDIVLSGKVGDNYVTKPQEITGYTLKTTPANAQGKFTQNEQSVTYIYTKNAIRVNDVIVHYQDDKGNQIASDIVLKGKAGDNYVTKPHEIAGYTLKTTPTNAQGKFTQDEQSVTYIYTKNPIKVNNVTVHYQDDKGNSIASDIILKGNKGESYHSTALVISGYTLKTTPTNASGAFTDAEQSVTYVYTKDAVTGADVKVHYLDENNNPISSDIILSGNLGEQYNSTALTIEGYTLKTTPENASGTFTEDEQNVIYVYTKDPAKVDNVTVHYQDEQGNPIAGDVVLSGNVGEEYNSFALEINGYTLKTTPKNAKGTFSEEDQEVIYVYAANSINTGGGSTTIITVPAADTTNNADNSGSTNNQDQNSQDSDNVQEGRQPISKAIMHNSFVYDENGQRVAGWFGKGSVVNTYGTKTINGKKYYVINENEYIKASNIDGIMRKLKHRSYIYNARGQRIKGKLLKKKKKVRTYGSAIKLHKKRFYIIGAHEYVKRANF